MANFGGKVRTVMHDLSQDKCCRCKCCQRIFSKQMRSGLKIETCEKKGEELGFCRGNSSQREASTKPAGGSGVSLPIKRGTHQAQLPKPSASFSPSTR